MIDKYRDTISAVIMLVVAMAYLYGSLYIKPYGDAAVDSRFFPQLLGTMLLILSIIQLVVSVRNRDLTSAPETGTENNPPTRINRGVFFTLIIILAYVLLINKLGFVISSTLFLFALTMLMAPAEHRRPVMTLVVSALFSAAVYAVFVYWFYVALPEGIIEW